MRMSMVPAGSKPTLMTEFTKLNATTNNERKKEKTYKSRSYYFKYSWHRKHKYLLSDITFHMGATSFSLQQPSSSLWCVSESSRAQPIFPSLTTLGLSQWQTYLKCGRCVLIKHGGFFNEGCNKSHIGLITTAFSDQSFICVMQVDLTDRLDWLYICSFVSDRGVNRGWFEALLNLLENHCGDLSHMITHLIITV